MAVSGLEVCWNFCSGLRFETDCAPQTLGQWRASYEAEEAAAGKGYVFQVPDGISFRTSAVDGFSSRVEV